MFKKVYWEHGNSESSYKFLLTKDQSGEWYKRWRTTNSKQKMNQPNKREVENIKRMPKQTTRGFVRSKVLNDQMTSLWNTVFVCLIVTFRHQMFWSGSRFNPGD